MSTQASVKGNRVDYFRVTGACALSTLLLFGQTAPLVANPTGGAVVAGSASIGAAGKTLTINQSSNNAIINWQSFSIANGETTRFFVPSSTSSTLNFVTGGNPSAIYGTLSSNGRLFLINPSGILVGSTGRIDTAGFLGSTLNPNKVGTGTIVFSGSSDASIVNQGSITASSGNVYLIANQVINEGALTAAQGEVGLAAGSNVLLQQQGDQHLFVQANPLGTKRAVGVSNAGTISAASAELRAAGGNAYALAINNSGSIAATGYKKINGQVYLTAGSGAISNSGSIKSRGATHGGTIHIASGAGTVSNSGILDVSATAAGGKGGTVLLSSAQGLASNTGVIDAKGGNGGAGGDVEVSGETVDVATGVVNTLAAGGQTGMFTIDPATFTVAASGGDETGAQVGSDLATTNITLNADNTVTIDDNITWTSGNTLRISTNDAGSTVAINAAISGAYGGLTLDTAAATDVITTGNGGSVDVANFNLQNGAWTQIVGQNGLVALPAFTASNDFEIATGSTFARFAGGNGSGGNPYQIVDVYGLQGAGSTSLLGDSFVLNNAINAAGTASWNSGAGFMPIGDDTTPFNGTFNGQGFTISSLTINQPASNFAALFGQTSAGAVVENVNLTADSITGNYAAGLVAENYGTVEGSSATGTVGGGSTSEDIGGLVAQNWGTVENSSSGGMVNGGANSGSDGGLVGANDGNITSSYSEAAVNGSNDVGGLTGYNFTSSLILNCYASGNVNGTQNVGGLVGYNGGTIETSYSTGAINGTGLVGGIAGKNAFTGTVTSSYWATDAGGSNGSLSTFGTNNGSVDGNTSGVTLASLDNQSTFQPQGTGAGQWNFGTTWTTNGNTTAPELLENVTGTAYTNSGVTVAPGTTITIIVGGVVVGTTTAGSNGVFSLSVSKTQLGGGLVLASGANSGDTFLQSSGLATTYFADDVWGSTLRVISDVASNTALKTAIGALTGSTITYGVTGTDLATNSGINLDLVSGTYNIDGNMTANGSFTVGANATLAGSVNATLQGTSIHDFGGLNSTAALVMQTTTGEIQLQNVGSYATPATVDGLTLNAAGPVDIESCYITLPSGDFSATGVGYSSTTNASGLPNGVNLFDTSILVSAGNITLNGTAGEINFFGSLESGIGVAIGTDGNTTAELSASSTGDLTNAGNITITGNAGNNITSQSYVDGVSIYNTNGTSLNNFISVEDGQLTINGTVSQTSANGTGLNGASISGVTITSGCEVVANGQGSISITGNTSGATTLVNGGDFSFINGVEISGLVEVNDGALTIQGTAGTLNTSGSTINAATAGDDGENSLPLSVGVIFDTGDGNGGDNILTGSDSTVTINGTGGAVTTTGAFTGSSVGVSFASGSAADFGFESVSEAIPAIASVESGPSATVSVTGTGGAVNAGNGANLGDASTTGVHISGDLTLEDGNSLSVVGTGGALTATNASGGSGNNRAVSQGIRIAGGAEIDGYGNADLTFNGTGGTVTASASQVVGSVGVNIGDDGNTTTTLSVEDGVLTINGTAGSSPNFGAGVAIHGTNGGQVIIEGSTEEDSFTQVAITGTGGTGYSGSGTFSGSSIPNSGVIIADNVSITTSEDVSISGKGGANSNGVSIVNLTGDTSLDETPVSASIQGDSISIVSTGGNVTVDAGLQASSQITITSPGTVTTLETGDTGGFSTKDLAINAAGSIYIDNFIAGQGTMNIVSADPNVTLGPDASITDYGLNSEEQPNVLTIAAGTNVSNGGYFINNSTLGGSAVMATGGAVYYIYSLDPSGDNFGGLSVSSSNVVFGATFPGTSLSGSGDFFFSGGTPTPNNTPPVNLIDLASIDDGSGSNLVPVSTVPQNGPLGNGGDQGTGNLGGYNGGDNGNGPGNGGLANSSGNGGIIGPGDAGALGGGALTNFSNPAVYSAFGNALGAEVYIDLSGALGLENGGWYPNDAQGGNGETTVGPGDCIVMEKGKIQNVSGGNVPDPLKNALGNGTLNNMPGH